MRTIYLAKLGAVVLLIAAGGRWPYDYYTLLRMVVCVVSAHCAYVAYRASSRISTGSSRLSGRVLAFGFIALLFNPFVPVYLARDTWRPIDLAVAIVLIGDLWADWRQTSKQHAPRQPGAAPQTASDRSATSWDPQ